MVMSSMCFPHIQYVTQSFIKSYDTLVHILDVNVGKYKKDGKKQNQQETRHKRKKESPG